MSISKSKVLITGSNGFVGNVLCDEASKRNIKIRRAIRKKTNLLGHSEQVLIDNIDEKTDWTEALQGCDVVIHLAARVHIMNDTAEDPLMQFRKVNKAGTEQLARSAAFAGVRRFVYASSVKVNGEETAEGQKLSELSPQNPQDPYGASKWEAELALKGVAKETGLEVVIIRPPLVYGSGVKGNFEQMLRVVTKGIPLPLASVNNGRDLIYVGNLVDALLLCATHPKAAGQTYLVSDGESVSTPELLKYLAKGLGIKSRIFPMPIFLLKFFAKLVGKSAQIERLTGSLQIDSLKIRRELGWVPPYTLKQGLQNTVQNLKLK